MPDMNYATLNSLTKYPSIPTYHEIDRGKLSGEAIPFDASDCHVTEKIDGTNGRIVIMPDGFRMSDPLAPWNDPDDDDTTPREPDYDENYDRAAEEDA